MARPTMVARFIRTDGEVMRTIDSDDYAQMLDFYREVGHQEDWYEVTGELGRVEMEEL